jgi:hypothetical protein
MGINANDEYPMSITKREVIVRFMSFEFAFLDLKIKIAALPISSNQSHILSPIKSTPDKLRASKKVSLTLVMLGF